MNELEHQTGKTLQEQDKHTIDVVTRHAPQQQEGTVKRNQPYNMAQQQQSQSVAPQQPKAKTLTQMTEDFWHLQIQSPEEVEERNEEKKRAFERRYAMMLDEKRVGELRRGYERYEMRRGRGGGRGVGGRVELEGKGVL